MVMSWHRLLGVALAGVCYRYPLRVTTEVELATRKQRLDVAIVRTAAGTSLPWEALPDGLTDPLEHSLLSIKALGDTFSPVAVWELVSHVVGYAKEVWNDDWEQVLLETEPRVRAIGVAVHRPQWLRPGRHPLHRELIPGVYEVEVAGLPVRLIVPREVELLPRNALWHLLSDVEERIEYGMQHFEVADDGLYNVLNDLRETYEMEGIDVAYTAEDYKREVLARYTPEERLAGLPLEARLAGLPLEARLAGLSRSEIEAYLKKLKAADRKTTKSPRTAAKKRKSR